MIINDLITKIACPPFLIYDFQTEGGSNDCTASYMSLYEDSSRRAVREPTAWPRGRVPFKRSGRGLGASWLRCFCLSVSERSSWAEATERICAGQVRADNKLTFLCAKTSSVCLCQRVL